jgi:hypothetical protein
MKQQLNRESLRDLVSAFRWPAAMVVLFVAALCAAPSQSQAYGHELATPTAAGAAGFDRPHPPEHQLTL